MINGNMYCDNKAFFGFLVKNLFSYQWFDTLVTVTDDIINALYDVSKGIVYQLIGVYSCMNYEYIEKKKKPVIDGEYVRYIANKYYPGMQLVLSNMNREENERKISEIMQNAETRINEMLDKSKQKNEAEKIIGQSENMFKTRVELKNIISSITAIYEEYTESQIENAYNKITGKKSAEEKSEKEITRMVIDLLQKQPTRRIRKNKIQSPDMNSVRDFLKIGQEEQ